MSASLDSVCEDVDYGVSLLTSVLGMNHCVIKASSMLALFLGNMKYAYTIIKRLHPLLITKLNNVTLVTNVPHLLQKGDIIILFYEDAKSYCN